MSTDKHMGTRRTQKRRQPDCHTIHEDGTSFPVDAHPGTEVLRTGVPQTNVIIGIQKSAGTTK